MDREDAVALTDTVDRLISEHDRLTADLATAREGARAGDVERQRLAVSLEKVQNIARAQLDTMTARISAARLAGAKAANKDLERCMEALKAEKEARAKDNADLTEQILAAEAAKLPQTSAPNWKQKPWRSAAYLTHVRQMPCAVPGCFSEMSNTGTRHAHHEGVPGNGGKGTKPSDERTFCLCAIHHRVRHDHGRSFLERMGVDVESAIRRAQDKWESQHGTRPWLER